MKSWQQYQAVYVHFPFCKQKCLYCDFVSYAGFTPAWQQQYAEAVCREIKERSRQHNYIEKNIQPQATIYFGGGTPSIMSIPDLTRIVQALQDYGYWQEPKEATIEANPGTVDLEKLQALRSLGFDRISFGVQSLHNNELQTIGRIHNAEQALEAITWAQKAGFKRINADVMYGLPGQTLASYQATVKELLAQGIAHLSAYSLIVEEETPLARLVEQGKMLLPEEDVVADMYDWTNSFLPSQGLKRYEVSNYAVPGQESRHNQIYWQYHPYAALGVAACDFNGRKRFTHTSKVQEYLENWQQGGATEVLTMEEMLSEFMFMGLRQLQGADLAEAEERFGVRVLEKYSQQLQPFFEQKLLQYNESNQYLALTETGMAVGNKIFEVFV